MITYAQVIIAGVALSVIALLADERTFSGTLREIINVAELLLDKMKEFTLTTLSSFTRTERTSNKSDPRSGSKTELSPSKFTFQSEEGHDRQYKTSYDQISLDEPTMRTANSLTESMDGSHSTVSLEAEDNGTTNSNHDNALEVITLTEKRRRESGLKSSVTAPTWSTQTVVKDLEERKRLNQELANLCAMASNEGLMDGEELKSLSTGSISLNDSIESNPEEDWNAAKELAYGLQQGITEWIKYGARFGGQRKVSKEREGGVRKKRTSSVGSYFDERLKYQYWNLLFHNVSLLKDEKEEYTTNPRPLKHSVSCPLLRCFRTDVSVPEFVSLKMFAIAPKRNTSDSTSPTMKSEKKSIDQQKSEPKEAPLVRKSSETEKNSKRHKDPVDREAILQALAMGMLRLHKKNEQIALSRERHGSPKNTEQSPKQNAFPTAAQRLNGVHKRRKRTLSPAYIHRLEAAKAEKRHPEKRTKKGKKERTRRGRIENDDQYKRKPTETDDARKRGHHRKNIDRKKIESFDEIKKVLKKIRHRSKKTTKSGRKSPVYEPGRHEHFGVSPYESPLQSPRKSGHKRSEKNPRKPTRKRSKKESTIPEELLNNPTNRPSPPDAAMREDRKDSKKRKIRTTAESAAAVPAKEERDDRKKTKNRQLRRTGDNAIRAAAVNVGKSDRHSPNIRAEMERQTRANQMTEIWKAKLRQRKQKKSKDDRKPSDDHNAEM